VGAVEVRVHGRDARDLCIEPGFFAQFAEGASAHFFAPFEASAGDTPEAGVAPQRPPPEQHTARLIADDYCDADEGVPGSGKATNGAGRLTSAFQRGTAIGAVTAATDFGPRSRVHGCGSLPSARRLAIASKSSATFWMARPTPLF